MRTYLRLLLLSAFLLIVSPLVASHVAGGGLTYRFLGDTVVSGTTMMNYEVTLWLYQDCVAGDPGAIADDDPAYFTFYETGSFLPIFVDTTVYYDRTPGKEGSITIPVTIASSPCSSGKLEGAPSVCLLRKKFVKRYTLPANSLGYKVVYQRCCIAAKVSNLVSSDGLGTTMYCDIPGAAIRNTSARFDFIPPQIACIGKALRVSHAAEDVDGDSLSYEFGVPYKGANDADLKPRVASPPPYDAMDYIAPFTAENPISSSQEITIDRATGVIACTPNRIGAYHIKVLCHEWRNGQMINTVSHEFQWTVADCQDITNTLVPDAGGDRTVLVGEKINFNVKGGTRYYWTPGTFLTSAFIANPVGTFTDPGEYIYRVSAVDDSGCTGTTEIKVTVLDHSDATAPSAFTPNGDGINDRLAPIPVKGSAIVSFRVYNRWGVEVFSSKGLAPGWDGKYNGTPQPGGVYAWMIEFADTNGKLHLKTGTTILLR